MKLKKLIKSSKKELLIRKIFHVEKKEGFWFDEVIYNPFGLKIYQNDLDIFVSANELNKLFKDTKYGVKANASCSEVNEPLFDKKKTAYDLLLDVYSLNESIVEIENVNREEYLNVDRDFFKNFI